MANALYASSPPMRYLDVCAGISASTVAWKPLGWEAAAYSEIEPAPRAVLAHHYPDTPLHGDFTTIRGDEYGPIDLLVGGTPCQDFSVAGLRAGLGGDRGNLSLEFLRLADRTRPRWVVWENVPGVLSIDGGRAFGAILGGLGELGYGFAYRVLDAQFFGVPQRRRRVFVVGCAGDWRGAAAVLSERHSLSGNPAPRREASEGASYRAVRSVALRGREDGGTAELGDEIAHALRASGGGGDKPHAMITHALRGEGFDASEDGTGRGTPLVPTMFYSNQSFDSGRNIDVSGTLRVAGDGGDAPAVAMGAAVRRLTPRECERLQGFPDDYTLVPHRGKPMADGPRYKALGNSMAVPVMRWIGERIQMVDTIKQERIAA